MSGLSREGGCVVDVVQMSAMSSSAGSCLRYLPLHITLGLLEINVLSLRCNLHIPQDLLLTSKQQTVPSSSADLNSQLLLFGKPVDPPDWPSGLSDSFRVGSVGRDLHFP